MFHRTQKTLIYIYSFLIKGHVKGYRWISRRRSCVRQRMGQRAQSVHTLTGHTLFLLLPCVQQPRSSPNPNVWGIFMELSSHRDDRSLIQSPALSSFWRMGDGAESSTLLIILWSFWWPVPHLNYPGSHQESIRTKNISAMWISWIPRYLVVLCQKLK